MPPWKRRPRTPSPSKSHRRCACGPAMTCGPFFYCSPACSIPGRGAQRQRIRRPRRYPTTSAPAIEASGRSRTWLPHASANSDDRLTTERLFRRPTARRAPPCRRPCDRAMRCRLRTLERWCGFVDGLINDLMRLVGRVRERVVVGGQCGRAGKRAGSVHGISFRTRTWAGRSDRTAATSCALIVARARRQRLQRDAQSCVGTRLHATFRRAALRRTECAPPLLRLRTRCCRGPRVVVGID